ncbi:MAG: hypothetical protein JSV09_12755 [Thermoplasmata archaeon]|nr:MAG: hypothetical protein JSV09_12755 [Thermoplasmata archaeon]
MSDSNISLNDDKQVILGWGLRSRDRILEGVEKVNNNQIDSQLKEENKKNTYFVLSLKQSLILLFLLFLMLILVSIIYYYDPDLITGIVLIILILICIYLFFHIRIETIKKYIKYFSFRIESQNKGRTLSIKPIRKDDDITYQEHNKK